MLDDGIVFSGAPRCSTRAPLIAVGSCNLVLRSQPTQSRDQRRLRRNLGIFSGLQNCGGGSLGVGVAARGCCRCRRHPTSWVVVTGQRRRSGQHHGPALRVMPCERCECFQRLAGTPSRRCGQPGAWLPFSVGGDELCASPTRPLLGIVAISPGHGADECLTPIDHMIVVLGGH
jgi:hypothetical protein